MEIEKMLKVDKTLEDEIPFCSEDVAILTSENPNLIMNDDTIYFGENPDIFGIFIGKDSRIIGDVLELIYNAEEEIVGEIKIE